MNNAFKAVPVTDKVWWVGAIDWNIKDFHGYATSRGTTYNAFLVVDDEVALIDTVKAPFRDEMMSRIASVVDPSDISVVVSNHAEMDHTGCLPYIIGTVRPDRVHASKMGLKALQSHFHDDLGVTAVDDGSSVPIGGETLTFYETRMLHWPDSMVSFLSGENILFSQDAFGMHLASTERYADMIDPSILGYEAAKYYANILMPYARLIKKFAGRLGSLDLPVRMVAPDHGPIYRRPEDIATIVGWYDRWSTPVKSRKAVITYDTMWESTATMARAIADGLDAEGIHVKLMSLSSYHRSDIATELLDASAFIAGSPTLNNNVFPTVADVMVYLKGLRPKGLMGGAFGSYGWSGESVKHLEENLDELGVERVAESVKVEYRPTGEDLMACREMGVTIGKKINDRIPNGNETA